MQTDEEFRRVYEQKFPEPRPVVDNPDSVTHFECESVRAPKQNVGTPQERRVTHTLVGASQRCMYCRFTRRQLAKRYGLET